jgi:hypothetical protein
VSELITAIDQDTPELAKEIRAVVNLEKPSHSSSKRLVWQTLLKRIIKTVWFHAALATFEGEQTSSGSPKLVADLMTAGGSKFPKEIVCEIDEWVNLCVEPLEKWASDPRIERPCHPISFTHPNKHGVKDWMVVSKIRMKGYLTSIISC